MDNILLGLVGSLGPLVGLFIARISKGRTLRGIIFGMLFFGTLGTWLFYTILGGYAMISDINGEMNVVQNMKIYGHADTAIQVITSLPLQNLMLLIFFALLRSCLLLLHMIQCLTLSLTMS